MDIASVLCVSIGRICDNLPKRKDVLFLGKPGWLDISASLWVRPLLTTVLLFIRFEEIIDAWSVVLINLISGSDV